MGARSKVILCAALLAGLGACGKKAGDAKDQPGSGSAATPPAVALDAAAAPAIDAAAPPPPAIDASTAAATAQPAELTAALDAIRPIVAITDRDARSKAACKADEDIRAKMRALDQHPPAGVDPAAWTELAERMGGGLNDMSIECAEDGFTNAGALTTALEVAPEFDALLAKPAP